MPSAYRDTEKTPRDPLGIDAVRAMARTIAEAVGDPDMHRSIPMKVARSIVERRVSPNEIAELCDLVASKRRSGQLRSPGAYFLSAIRRIFQREEVAW